MKHGRLEGLLEAALPPRHDTCADAELLALFLHGRDESAFETLLRRHTPGVRAACRTWLRDEADIDDAAQATFLVLVQRAGAIRNRAALGPWLYGVAANVARRLRQRQRHASHLLPDDLPGRSAGGAAELRDLLAIELARLPEKYRLPVQLCYSAGLTTAEAAERLGWPKGTVLTRLAWARQRLQKCLARHGVAPAALGALPTVSAPAVSAPWLRLTLRAVTAFVAGEPLIPLGVPERTIALTEGVVRAMVFDRLKMIALVVVLAIGLAGVGLRHWAAAGGPPGDRAGLPDPNARHPAQRANDREPEGPVAVVDGKEPGRAEDARPAAPGRRREAVIRAPAGTFVKEVAVEPYGSGRITWTYEEDRVIGLIEASVMGVEVELATEAEVSLSRTGTIYGILTSARVNHLRLPPQFAELKPFVGLYAAAEPLLNEALIDLPFSYQFRLSGDRLVITNFRMLLAGPNPLGKLGGLTAGKEMEPLKLLIVFQALGTALEGTYTTPQAKDKPAPGARPAFPRFRSPDARKPASQPGLNFSR